MRLIGFSPQQQIQLNDLHKASSPVELTNCEVKHSRQGQSYDIMLKSNTQIKKSPKKIDMDAIMASTLESKPITLDALPTLPQYEKVSVDVKVLQLFKTEEVGQEKKVKRDALIADHTAATKVVLWEQQIDALQEGKCYNLTNFHVKEFQSKKHLSMPKSDFEISPIDNIPSNHYPMMMNTQQSIMSKLLVSHNSTIINLVFSVEHVSSPYLHHWENVLKRIA